MTAPLIGVAWLTISFSDVSSCKDLASDLQETFERAKIAMEPQANMASIYDRSTEAKDRCANDEQLAYLRLRSAELGRGALVGRQPESTREEWRSLARELSARFPTSVRIATIQARASGALADAHRAADLDPSYAPAQVALAAALVATKPADAATLLVSLKDLGAVSDGYSVLARVRFALHDSKGAAKEAMRALHGRKIDLIEPDARDPRPLSEAHEILGLVYLERHDYRNAILQLRSAAPDSTKAQAILDSPPAAVKKFLSLDRRPHH